MMVSSRKYVGFCAQIGYVRISHNLKALPSSGFIPWDVNLPCKTSKPTGCIRVMPNNQQ